MITVYDCKFIELPRAQRIEYNLTTANSNIDLPFDIARVYYSYDVPAGKERGGHAHKKLQQLIIPIVGSFSLSLDDGTQERRVCLNQPDCGLYIPGQIWTQVKNIASGSVCMVLASLPYDENEYIRDYDQFLEFKKLQSPRQLPLTAGSNGSQLG